MEHHVLQFTLTRNPLDVFDELGFQAGSVGLILRLRVDKDDRGVHHLDFTAALRGVRQRSLKRTERKLPGEEHEEGRMYKLGGR